MIAVVLRTGTLTPTRSARWQETLPSLDGAGNVPSGVTQVRYVLYWRSPAGRLYENVATIAANEFDVDIAYTLMNPATLSAYLDAYWTLPEGGYQRFARYEVQLIDMPVTGSSVPAITGAPYAVSFTQIGFVTVGTMNGVLVGPVGGGILQEVTLSIATVASSGACTVELYDETADEATAIGSIPEGDDHAKIESLALTLTENHIYRLRITAAGTDAEMLTASVLVYPAG